MYSAVRRTISTDSSPAASTDALEGASNDGIHVEAGTDGLHAEAGTDGLHAEAARTRSRGGGCA